ncbi:MAG: hypothetical protein AB7P08_06030 [Burkholderiales bacterium]
MAASLAALALAFAQLAVSAHACDVTGPRGKQPVAAQPVTCHEIARDEGVGENLCEQHCQYGDASVESNAPAPVAMHVAGPALRLEPAGTFPVEAISPSRADVPPIAAPPPAILFGVLRI